MTDRHTGTGHRQASDRGLSNTDTATDEHTLRVAVVLRGGAQQNQPEAQLK